MSEDGFIRSSISWPDEILKARVEAAAKAERRSVSNWIVCAVLEYLDRHKRPYEIGRVGAAVLNEGADATHAAEAEAEAAIFGRTTSGGSTRGAAAPVPAGPGAARTGPPVSRHKGRSSR